MPLLVLNMFLLLLLFVTPVAAHQAALYFLYDGVSTISWPIAYLGVYLFLGGLFTMLIGFFSVYINPYKKEGDLKNPIKFAVNVLIVTLGIVLINDPEYFVKNMIETITYVSCLIFFEIIIIIANLTFIALLNWLYVKLGGKVY